MLFDLKLLETKKITQGGGRGGGRNEEAGEEEEKGQEEEYELGEGRGEENLRMEGEREGGR